MELSSCIEKEKLKVMDSGWEFERELEFIQKLPFRKIVGEVEGILVAKARGCEFASDDAKARRVAQENEIPVTGTIGLLKDFVEFKITDLRSSRTLLKEMKEKANFWYEEDLF